MSRCSKTRRAESAFSFRRGYGWKGLWAAFEREVASGSRAPKANRPRSTPNHQDHRRSHCLPYRDRFQRRAASLRGDELAGAEGVPIWCTAAALVGARPFVAFCSPTHWGSACCDKNSRAAARARSAAGVLGESRLRRSASVRAAQAAANPSSAQGLRSADRRLFCDTCRPTTTWSSPDNTYTASAVAVVCGQRVFPRGNARAHRASRTACQSRASLSRNVSHVAASAFRNSVVMRGVPRGSHPRAARHASCARQCVGPWRAETAEVHRAMSLAGKTKTFT